MPIIKYVIKECSKIYSNIAFEYKGSKKYCFCSFRTWQSVPDLAMGAKCERACLRYDLLPALCSTSTKLIKPNPTKPNQANHTIQGLSKLWFSLHSALNCNPVHTPTKPNQPINQCNQVIEWDMTFQISYCSINDEVCTALSLEWSAMQCNTLAGSRGGRCSLFLTMQCFNDVMFPNS